MSPSKKTLRFVTYNIHSCVGIDNKYDPARVAAFIKDFDVAGLQEVEAFDHRRGYDDQFKTIQKLSGMSSVFAPNLVTFPWLFGNSLFSKHYISWSSNLPLAFPPGLLAEPRGLLQAQISYDDLGPIFVWVTHFGLSEEEEVYSAQQLVQRSAQLTYSLGGDTPNLVILGDLNAEPSSRALKVLTDAGFQSAGDQSVKTWPEDHPEQRIDYVLFTRKWELVDWQALDLPYSDHRPLLAELALKRADLISGRRA